MPQPTLPHDQVVLGLLFCFDFELESDDYNANAIYTIEADVATNEANKAEEASIAVKANVVHWPMKPTSLMSLMRPIRSMQPTRPLRLLPPM
jgi:hypothetical protein